MNATTYIARLGNSNQSVRTCLRLSLIESVCCIGCVRVDSGAWHSGTAAAGHRLRLADHMPFSSHAHCAADPHCSVSYCAVALLYCIHNVCRLGALEAPQNSIVGARYQYLREDLQFACSGLFTTILHRALTHLDRHVLQAGYHVPPTVVSGPSKLLPV